MTKCYEEVKLDSKYQEFKEIFEKTKGITLKKPKVEENLTKYYKEMESSFDDTVSFIIQTLQSRIGDIKDIHAT